MREKQIGFRASSEESKKFRKAAAKMKAIDGKLTISAFLRGAAHKLADEVLGNDKA